MLKPERILFCLREPLNMWQCAIIPCLLRFLRENLALDFRIVVIVILITSVSFDLNLNCLCIHANLIMPVRVCFCKSASVLVARLDFLISFFC